MHANVQEFKDIENHLGTQLFTALFDMLRRELGLRIIRSHVKMTRTTLFARSQIECTVAWAPPSEWPVRMVDGPADEQVMTHPESIKLDKVIDVSVVVREEARPVPSTPTIERDPLREVYEYQPDHAVDFPYTVWGWDDERNEWLARPSSALETLLITPDDNPDPYRG
ncbi:hypothetical protein GIKK_35 [Gordonia phage GiKK]|nr:hypothetical protein GIKK_35 [Gordonia phage GiKK]